MTNTKKVIFNVTATVALFVVTIFTTFKVMGWIEAHTWKLPQAHDMAVLAMKVQTEEESFQELQKRVSACIRIDAKKGARETEIYVGEFSKDAVKEIIRQLAFCGYGTKLTSPLSGTDDFLEITW